MAEIPLETNYLKKFLLEDCRQLARRQKALNQRQSSYSGVTASRISCHLVKLENSIKVSNVFISDAILENPDPESRD